MAQQIAKLTDEVSPAVLIDRDVVHVTQTNPCLAQAIADRLRRKTGPVLLTAKSLLLRGGDEHAVAHKRRRGIRVESVESKDDQAGPFFKCARYTTGGRKGPSPVGRCDAALSDKASKRQRKIPQGPQSLMIGVSDNRSNRIAQNLK